MRILITGAGGQLGHELDLLCTAAGDDVTAVARSQLDIGDRDQVHQVIGAVRPDVVVNCAAWTAVDACESDELRAMTANALGPRWLGEATARSDAHLIHVSTDYVFDGTKTEPYHEWDTPNPLSVYGASKLAGEREVAASGARATIVRTAWVMGAHGSNMLKTVIGLKDRNDLAFVDDQRGCPTFTADLAAAIRSLAAARLTGTYHLTNRGSTTWFEFVRDVLVAVGGSADQVRPIATADLDPPRPAPRPANSVLANVAWENSGLGAMPEYRDALRRTLIDLGI